MSMTTVGLFLRHLALSEEISRLATTSDHDLLAIYEAERGQAAFTELVRRHGPMVLRTCRRLLGGWSRSFTSRFTAGTGRAAKSCTAGRGNLRKAHPPYWFFPPMRSLLPSTRRRRFPRQKSRPSSAKSSWCAVLCVTIMKKPCRGCKVFGPFVQ